MLEIIKISTPPFKEISQLLHDSFAERLKDGMNFGCATFTEDDVKRELSNATAVIGAYDNNELIGVVVLNYIIERFGLKYANHQFLAVASHAKGRGVASKMFAEVYNIARENQLDFIKSYTAEGAKSSISYHLKNGFKIIGKYHQEGRTYDSYVFLCPISWKGRILSSYPMRKIYSLFYRFKS